jgi:hypothetical protein
MHYRHDTLFCVSVMHTAATECALEVLAMRALCESFLYAAVRATAPQ